MKRKYNTHKLLTRLRRSALTLATLSFLVTAVAAQSGLRLSEYKKARLPNGMNVILMKKAGVPLVSISISVRNGSLADPAGMEGLASVTSDLLRKGTATRSAQKIASELDFIGATLDFSTGPEFVRGEAEFMKKDLAGGLSLLSDILTNPTFPVAEVEKLIKQRIDSVKDAKDQAQRVIPNYFMSGMFGNTGYGRPPDGDENSLRKITRADILGFYRKAFGSDTVTIAVVGDIEPEECLKLLEKNFGAWGQKAVPAKLPPPAASIKGRKVILVDNPDSTQTYFAIGNLGISRTDPDRVVLDVVNTVFGGRFTSMLNEALRVNSGLTYGASSRFFQRLTPGPFIISSYTQNKTTVEAIDMALDVLNKLHKDGLTQEQLSSAKAYIKGQFPQRVETSNQLADLLIEYNFFGLDDSELSGYFQRIDAVSLQDVRRVIDRCYPSNDLLFVLIGKAEGIKDKIGKYGSGVVVKSISQPGFY